MRTSKTRYIRSLQHKLNSYSRLAGRWKREWLFPPKKRRIFLFLWPGPKWSTSSIPSEPHLQRLGSLWVTVHFSWTWVVISLANWFWLSLNFSNGSFQIWFGFHFPFQIDPHILTLLFRLLWFFRFELHVMVKARWLVDNLVNNELHGRAGRVEFKSQWCDSLQWWSSFQWYRSLKWCSSLQW